MRLHIAAQCTIECNLWIDRRWCAGRLLILSGPRTCLHPADTTSLVTVSRGFIVVEH
jgi:hypothetical protein